MIALNYLSTLTGEFHIVAIGVVVAVGSRLHPDSVKEDSDYENGAQNYQGSADDYF